jgi:hypothetical protein
VERSVLAKSTVLIVEDRLIFHDNFFEKLWHVLDYILEQPSYDICYLYREPEQANGATSLLLTAYLVSRSGLKKLLTMYVSYPTACGFLCYGNNRFSFRL